MGCKTREVQDARDAQFLSFAKIADARALNSADVNKSACLRWPSTNLP